MTVNTTNITGFIVLPNDTVREKSKVIFTMTGFDTDADDNAVVVTFPIEAPIATDGSIDIDLWPNPEGVRSTFYRVTFSIYNGVNPHLVDGGLIEVPATGGPYDLNDLLPVAPPSGATVDEYIAQLAASVAASEAAAASAESDADAAAASAAAAQALIVSIDDYGGVGDGVTESAAAFQAAEVDQNAGSIGPIYLPVGTYVCSETTYVPSGDYFGPGLVKFGGDGTYTDTLSYAAPGTPGPIYNRLHNDNRRIRNQFGGLGAGAAVDVDQGGVRGSTFFGDRSGEIVDSPLRSSFYGAWTGQYSNATYADFFGASTGQFARTGNRNAAFGNNSMKWGGTDQAVDDLHDFFNGTNEVLESGTAQAGAAGTITIAADTEFTENDDLNGFFIEITGGTGSGQSRVVTDYVASTKVATVSPNWTTAPDATSTYDIVQRDLSVWVNKRFEDIFPNVRDDLDGSTASVYSGSPRTPDNLTQFGDVASGLIPSSNSDFEDNCSFGRDSLIHGLIVQKCVSFGYKSFAQMIEGFQSVALGRSAGEFGLGHVQDVFIGNSAGYRAIYTQQNAIVGFGAARRAASMSRNSIFGSEVLEDACDAQADTAFQLTSKTDWQMVGNTAFGQRAGANLLNATGNTFLGTKMGQNIGSAETRTAEAILEIGNGDYNSAVPTIAGDMATGQVIVNGHHDGFDGSTDAAALLSQLTVVHGDLTSAIPAPQSGARGIHLHAETGATGITASTGDGSNFNFFCQDAADNNVGGWQYDHSVDQFNIRAGDSVQFRALGAGGINITNPNAPASASDTGAAGDVQWDADYVYVCTATDTWKRAAIATW